MKKFNLAGLTLSLLAIFSISIPSAFAGSNISNHSHNDAGGYWHTHGGSGNYGSGNYGSGNYGSGYYNPGNNIRGGGYIRETFRVRPNNFVPAPRGIYCPLGGCSGFGTKPMPDIYPMPVQPIPINPIGQLPNTNIINDSFKNINVKNIYSQAQQATSGAGGLLGLALPLIGAHILSGGLSKERPIVNYYPAHSVTAVNAPTRHVVKVIEANHRMPEIRNINIRPAPSYQQRQHVIKRMNDVCNLKNGSCARKARMHREYDHGNVSYDSYDYDANEYRSSDNAIEIIGGRDHGQEDNVIATIRSYDDGEEAYKVDY